jgi:hypothetical protein
MKKIQMKRLSKVWKNEKKEFEFSDDIFTHSKIQILLLVLIPFLSCHTDLVAQHHIIGLSATNYVIM